MENSFSIYKIAFPWYSFIGGLLVFVFGIPLSHFIGPPDSIETLNPSLISPVAQFLIPKRLLHKEIPLREQRDEQDKEFSEKEEKIKM